MLSFWDRYVEVRGADARARLAFTACSEVADLGTGFAAGLGAAFVLFLEAFAL